MAILWRNARPFFAWWASEEDAPNPFANADRPPEGDNSPDVIHIDDIRALVAACKGREFDDLRDEAIIRVMFDTGTRLGELAGIQLADWDTRQDFLLVDGKSGPRLVPMSASTAEALARYVRRARNRHRHADLPALWLGRRGALTARSIGRMLDRRCEQAGIGHINPHRFRHTFAHEFRMHGGDDGHSSTSPAGSPLPCPPATAAQPPPTRPQGPPGHRPGRQDLDRQRAHVSRRPPTGCCQPLAASFRFGPFTPVHPEASTCSDQRWAGTKSTPSFTPVHGDASPLSGIWSRIGRWSR